MAKLIECKTCKKEVANNAKVCPHCGTKNPGLKTKDVVIGLFTIAVIIFMINVFTSETDYYNDYKNKTLVEAKKLNSTTLEKVAKAYIQEKKLPSEYELKFSNCLGQLVHDKLDSYTIDKMLNWCQEDYDNTPNNEMKTYYNTASLLDDFSVFDGSYAPLENVIKTNMKDSDSYKHIKTLYSLVYHGKNITPHMNVETTFKGTNSFGATVTSTITAKVNAQTKELYDIK